jgi:alpha/beta superfamily hydrolase
LAGEIRSLMISGPAGRLEALFNVGAPGARYAALICHPHPLHGGTLHNKVVFHAAKALTGFGFPALRFNFRGAGLSEGTHDGGRGEQEDVRAALEYLYGETGLPVLFAGFSFGAATGLRVACREARVEGCISLGTPVNVEGRHYTYGFLKECRKPLLMISGGNDIYSPRMELQQAFQSAPGPKRLVIVEGADHFFLGHLGEMQAAIEGWVRETFLSPPAEARG